MNREKIEDAVACTIWFVTFLALFWVASVADAGLL